MTADLSHAHRDTYEMIFRQPAAHNLHWRDVRSLLAVIANVDEQPNGNIKVTRNGHSMLLHESINKDVDADTQLRDLRKFLQTSGDAARAPAAENPGYLVVIDHREARVYKSLAAGSSAERITPSDTDEESRHLHVVEAGATGQRRPEPKPYFEAIARALQDATHILLFGSGTGASSAMEHFFADLRQHHKPIAARVVGSVAVDEHHSSEAQLLAKAREFYAAHASTSARPAPTP